MIIAYNVIIPRVIVSNKCHDGYAGYGGKSHFLTDVRPNSKQMQLPGSKYNWNA